MWGALSLGSKEQRDAELDRRIEGLRRKNQALIQRYQEIEEDRRKAEEEGVAVTTRARPPEGSWGGGGPLQVLLSPGEKRVVKGPPKPGHGGPPRVPGLRPTRPPRGGPPEPLCGGAGGDSGTPGQRGGWGRRSRGAGGDTGPDRKSKEWEERRRRNIEKMNEEMEKIAEYERNQRDGVQEKNPVRNFLDDPRRSGSFRGGDRREGSRRHVRNWGGPDFHNLKAGLEREKPRGGPGRHPSFQTGGQLDMTLSMTGRERAEYVRWKKERDQIDRERVARHREPSGQWRREWDAQKSNSMFKEGSMVPPPLETGGGGEETGRLPPKPPLFGEFLPPRRPPPRRKKGRGGGTKPYRMHDNRWEEKEPPREGAEIQGAEEIPGGAPPEPPVSPSPEEDEDQWEDVSEEEEEEEEEEGSPASSNEADPPRRLTPPELMGSPKGVRGPPGPPPGEEARPDVEREEEEEEDGTQGPVAPVSVEITDFQRVGSWWKMDDPTSNLTYNFSDWGDYSDFDWGDLGGHQVPHGYRAILALYALIFLLGVLGNGAVIWVTGFELRRTVNGIWFLNLSVADLLCCLALPFLALPLAQDHHWPLGGLACKVVPSLTILNMFASVLLLTAISVDRCMLVTRPVWCQNHRTLGLARGACAAAWFLATLLTLPSFIFRTTRSDTFSEKTTCVMDYQAVKHQQHLTELLTFITRFLCGFLMPFVVITGCYSLLLLRIHSRGFARSHKATKLILVVIISFFVCWLPYHVVGLVIASTHPSSTVFKGAREADPIVTGVAYVNSCINPIIYVVMGQDFKDKFQRSWRAVLRSVLSDDLTSTAGDSRVKTKSTVDNQSVSTIV